MSIKCLKNFYDKTIVWFDLEEMFMKNNCKWCGSKYDFRMVQISELFGEVGISLSENLRQVNSTNAFKFCPVCGRELTKENFDGHKI